MHADYPSLVLVPSIEHIIGRLRDLAEGEKSKQAKRRTYTMWVDWLLRPSGVGSLGQFLQRPDVRLEPVFPLKSRFMALVMGQLSVALQERQKVSVEEAEGLFDRSWAEVKFSRDYNAYKEIKVMAPTAQGVTNRDLRLSASAAWRSFVGEKKVAAKHMEYQRLTLPIEVLFPEGIGSDRMAKFLCKFCIEYSRHPSPLNNHSEEFCAFKYFATHRTKQPAKALDFKDGRRELTPGPASRPLMRGGGAGAQGAARLRAGEPPEQRRLRIQLAGGARVREWASQGRLPEGITVENWFDKKLCLDFCEGRCQRGESKERTVVGSNLGGSELPPGPQGAEGGGEIELEGEQSGSAECLPSPPFDKKCTVSPVVRMGRQLLSW